MLRDSNTAHVSADAVVSWPAMSMVIRSSRNCVLVVSSPRMSTMNRSSDGLAIFG